MTNYRFDKKFLLDIFLLHLIKTQYYNDIFTKFKKLNPKTNLFHKKRPLPCPPNPRRLSTSVSAFCGLFGSFGAVLVGALQTSENSKPKAIGEKFAQKEGQGQTECKFVVVEMQLFGVG
jgi:hypothetical protein